MCGIAGILSRRQEQISASRLKRMTDEIRHRGPDGEGLFVQDNLALGHRRLSIIDLSDNGRQPMETDCGRFIITFNGEIYNFKEIRHELLALGYSFKSQTDTEVILYAFKEWGTQVISRLNGMFSFAIWDSIEKKLILVRDRYGIKPVYYATTDQNFYFASEIKAILTQDDFKKAVNVKALYEYFTFQNIFTNQTLFENVNILPAGHILTISVTENSFSQTLQKYWDFHFSEDHSIKDEHEAGDELKRLFTQAVQRQLITDVEIGSYLSGGMDSGSITAVAAQSYPFIKSFTCGFDLNSASGIELSYDERSKAEFMSYHFKTEHYEMVLKAGDMERCMPRLAWHMEEMRVGQSYPNFYAAKLASKFVKVVLSGAGGDELFGGYPWRYYRAVVNQNFEDYVDKYYSFWQRLIPNTTLQKLFKPVWNEVSEVWTRDIFRDVFMEHKNELASPEDYINHSLYFESKTFLHGLLVVDDKLSMAHGLETRVPFLDNDLVDFAMRLPIKYKLQNLDQVVRLNENEFGPKNSKYFQKTNDGKTLLRQVMKDFIPDQILQAEKQGFSAPDASWFKGESINYIKNVVYDSKSPLYQYLDQQTVQSLAELHFSGQENKRLLIWSLISFNEFLKEYF